MNFKENNVEFTLDEAIEKFDFPSDINNLESININKVVTSYEFVQSYETLIKLTCAIKTQEITGEEIENWKESEKYLSNLDIDAAKDRIKIENQEEPYKWVDWDE